MAFPEGWGYYAPITISNGSADYQTKVTIYEGSGTNGTNVVYCGGHIQADFDDLRFTGSDFVTLLDYWIESITGTTPNQVAIVWVQNNATPSTTGRMYYGNPDATPQFATPLLAGEAAFPFFDDFNDGSLDTNKWTNLYGSGVTESGGVVTVLAAGAFTYGIRGKTLYGTNYALRLRVKPTHINNIAYLEVARWYASDTTQYAAYFDHVNAVYNGYYLMRNEVAYYTTLLIVGEVADWQILDLIRNASTSGIGKINDANAVEITTNVNTANSYPDLATYAANSQIAADWVLVRKYTATEPFFAFGSEETTQSRRRSAFFPFM